MNTLAPVRRTTITVATSGHWVSATSTFCFSGTILPPRRPSSAVMIRWESQSCTRPAMESGEKPPKITEWMAPMRAQASMA